MTNINGHTCKLNCFITRSFVDFSVTDEVFYETGVSWINS